MDFNIREASVDDLEILVDFQIKMAKETEDMILEKDIITQGILSGLKDKNKAEYFVAEYQNEIIGSLMITKEWSDWRNMWVLWIQSVYVAETHRQKGVYKALYTHIINMMDKKGYGGVRLYVDKTNTKAQQVYSKLGMNGEHYQLFEFMSNK